MKSPDNIERLINDLHDTTSADMDQRVLTDVLQALEESKRTPAATQPNVTGTIMKSPITKLAAAAVILLAALLSAHQIADWRSTGRAEHEPRGGLRGRPGMDEQVAEASVIIRGRTVQKAYTGRQTNDEREVQLSIEVDKLLYGKLPSRTISALDWESPDNPVVADGRDEGILFLHEFEDGHWRIRSGYTKYADLDAVENEILEVIESGAHLTERSRDRGR
jgi:hypothetical protein